MKNLWKKLTQRLHNNVLSLKGRLSRVKSVSKTADSFLITAYYESGAGQGTERQGPPAESGPVADGPLCEMVEGTMEYNGRQVEVSIMFGPG